MKTYFGLTRLISRHITYKMILFNRASFHMSNVQCCSETINDLSLQSTKFATNDINEIICKAFKIGPRGHKVYVLQPYIKFGWGKKRNTEPELQLEEAVTLVKTLDDWEVIEYDKVPLNSFENSGFFGTGKIDQIKLKIQQRNISAVFISINMLTASQHHFLESEFQLPVYDRFLIIMQIFREHAKSPEAKLQISMAEMPYLWSRVMYANNSSCNQPDASSSAIQGCGVSAYAFHETRKKHLRNYEAKIKNSLEKLKSHREHSRKRRKENEFPIIAVVGYTNAGKTSLIKALTGSKKLEPKNHLFATLDVTFHEGFLPCNLKILYVDTIGFISDIPTNLIEPFKVTLQDAMVADIIIHIEDISHPDLPYQRDQVNKTLKQLKIDNTLLDNIITVSNKIDLLTPVHTDVEFLENAIQFSCKTGTGIEELKQKLEQIILKSTNRKKMIIRTKNGGPEMIWLCQETAVTGTTTDPKNDNYILLNVIITQSCLNRFKSKFIGK